MEIAALRFRGGCCFTTVRGDDKAAERPGQLRPIRPSGPSRPAAKSWSAEGGVLNAVLAIPARSRAKRAIAACSVSPDASGGTSHGNAVALTCGGRTCDDVERPGRGGRSPVPPEKIDKWMQKCIAEIVGKIGKAPFLVHVFDDGGDAALKLEMEAADPANWDAIRNRWVRGVTPQPDGIILVEELKGEEGDGEAASTSTARSGVDDGRPGASGSRTWGIVFQGWGGDCAACYILSTCRVRSTSGFCTHFYLTRTRGFEETADVQLMKSWLVERPQCRQQP